MSSTGALKKQVKSMINRYVATDYVYFQVQNGDEVNELHQSVLDRDSRGQNVIVVTFVC